MTNAPTVPAGWYPDPAGGPKQRWWDGTQWTEHFQEPYSPAVAAAVLKAPEGTPVYTPWIWIVALLPLLQLIPLATFDFGGYVRGAMSPYGSIAMMTSPGYLLLTLGGWVIYGLSALFAYLDWRRLAAVGMPRPFHFAWVFLSSVVYVIGRSVVVRRRTGRGITPMWVSIAGLVLSFIFAIYITAAMTSAIFATIPTYGS
ncbi:MAG: hypothetical protein JWP19_2634 [Rhodoglobus sp.]|nr:hypothetical protein [Rhodoglobus sp.]